VQTVRRHAQASTPASDARRTADRRGRNVATEPRHPAQDLDEEHYRLVADHAGDAIGRIAADGSVLWTSPSTQRVFGLSAEHLQGTARAEVVHPEDLPAVAAATDSVFSGGEPAATVRFRVPQADGTVRWMESHLSPVRDAGRVVEVVTLARDVTAQVRLQAQLADGRREAELARAQLVEALDASPTGS
jgi:PAS domain S-box-containing protein